MDAVNKNIKIALTWCLFVTAMLVSGIPLIIVGAVKGIWGVMGCGIAFVVIGFYATPILWVSYADKRSYKRIVSAIVVEHIYSLKQIATHLNLKEKLVLDRVDTCIRREFLIGYIREGDLIRPNVRANAKTATCKCKACGASFEYQLGASAKCPYCRTIADE